jgi:tRNA(adenine34) deaminase
MPNKVSDKFFMEKALRHARRAFALGEVPVGAVIVKDNKIISWGYNTRESKQNPTHHAELIAINRAAKKLRSWRLLDCTLYVTLEPCTMCAGAIVLARLPRIVYAAPDPKAGACGSVLSLLDQPKLNHRPQVVSGVLADKSARLLKDFFRSIRNNRKNR